MSELINWPVFSEIVSMDQDEPGFALSLVQTFFEQAQDTLKKVHTILSQEPGPEQMQTLSGHGHYLKGSAAALGLGDVMNQCEIIQNAGKDGDLPELKRAVDVLEGKLVETRKVLGEYFKMEL